jgi:hypothetical protein
MRVRLNHPPLDECQICGGMPVVRHEVFFGTANRRLSIQWGFLAWLCPLDHNEDWSRDVHHNKEFRKKMQREYQEEAEALGWTREEFKETFGENFIT